MQLFVYAAYAHMEISRRHAEWQKILALTEHSQAHPRKAMVRRRLGDAGPGGRGKATMGVFEAFLSAV